MSATISIIQFGTKTVYSYIGDLDELTKAFTSVALRDETIAESITRAAIEVDDYRQTTRELIHMTKTQKP